MLSSEYDHSSKLSVLDALKDSLAAALRTPEGVAAPIALVWTDADGQWQPMIPALRVALPQLFELGEYAPEHRRGPAIWLRCVVDKALPEVSLPDGLVPIVYLPRVSRQTLRAGGECPPQLQPLIELQYSGAVWHQRNGRDWTVEAFLSSADALGLEMGTDQRTKEAMLRALPQLAEEPVAALRGRRLEADDFEKLLVGDPVRDVLSWISDEKVYRERSDGAQWATFRSLCTREFKFDPEEQSPSMAAEFLIDGGGAWDAVWSRFEEAPKLYAGIGRLLRDATPRDLLADASRQPSVNADQESELRNALQEVATLPADEACAKVLALEDAHSERRDWVWAQLGESPLALLLEPLARLARATKQPLGATTLAAMCEAYVDAGWRCDEAALDAMAAVQNSESALLRGVLQAIYVPWLDAAARVFQLLADKGPGGLRSAVVGVSAEAETCILFADGLRFDVGMKLLSELEARGCRVTASHRLAPVPSVTPTAKPVASPAHRMCEESEEYGDLTPKLLERPSNAKRLRDEMARQGIEIIESEDLAFPSGAKQGGWTEFGNLDKNGHALGVGMAQLVAGEVDALANRVMGLLEVGWSSVRVVTDHGWLLVPGELPKVELPTFLTGTKWARCAVVTGQVPQGMPVFPWHWNSQIQIASPPGIGSYFAGKAYAHGGVSPQECVVPDLVVRRGTQAAHARITELAWRGMRCRVKVETNSSDVQVDIRMKLRDANSSIVAEPKSVDTNGEVSLVVIDDQHEGFAAVVVVLGPGGQVIDQAQTQVGEVA